VAVEIQSTHLEPSKIESSWKSIRNKMKKILQHATRANRAHIFHSTSHRFLFSVPNVTHEKNLDLSLLSELTNPPNSNFGLIMQAPPSSKEQELVRGNTNCIPFLYGFRSTSDNDLPITIDPTSMPPSVPTSVYHMDDWGFIVVDEDGSKAEENVEYSKAENVRKRIVPRDDPATIQLHDNPSIRKQQVLLGYSDPSRIGFVVDSAAFVHHDSTLDTIDLFYFHEKDEKVLQQQMDLYVQQLEQLIRDGFDPQRGYTPKASLFSDGQLGRAIEIFKRVQLHRAYRFYQAPIPEWYPAKRRRLIIKRVLWTVILACCFIMMWTRREVDL